MKVQDIMFDRLTKISGDATVQEAAKLLEKREFGALLVEVDQEVVGMVTGKDFIWKVVAPAKDPRKLKVKDIMSAPLIMIDRDEDVIKAANMLAKYNIKRLVVMEEGEIVGIISTSVIGKNLKGLIK